MGEARATHLLPADRSPGLGSVPLRTSLLGCGHEGWAEWVQCTMQPLLLWVTHRGALGVGGLGKAQGTLLWVPLLGPGLGQRGTGPFQPQPVCGSAVSAVGWQNLIAKINNIASSYEKPSTSRTHFITCSAVLSLMFYLVKRD